MSDEDTVYWKDVAESLQSTLEATQKQAIRYQDALRRIIDNRDNKNWRKPEMVMEAEQALKSP